MQKSLLSKVKLLLITVLTAGAIWSCQDEKPQIYFPEIPTIVIPKDSKYIEAITPDTISFEARDSVVIRLKTHPYNLLGKETVTMQISNPDSTEYKNASILTSPVLKDSIWNIMVHLNNGIHTGDVIHVMVSDTDTVMMSKPIVLKKIRYLFETLTPDTLTFEAGDSVIFKFKTIPYDLPGRKEFSLMVCDPDGQEYQKGEIRSLSFSQDSIWNLVMGMKIGALNGDIVSVMLSDSDTVICSKPIVLKKYKYVIETLTPDTLSFEERDSALINLRTAPANLLSKKNVSVAITNPDGTRYNNAVITSLYLRDDSIWNIVLHMKNGMRNGDIINVKIDDTDTIVYSKPIVLNKIKYKIETITPDTLVFNEGNNAILNLRTTPSDLLTRENSKIEICDASGKPYQYATINNVGLRNDTIWDVVLRIEYGMKTGDIIKARFSYKDTALYSKPVILKMIPKPEPTYYALNIESNPISAYESGQQATIRLRTVPWNVLLKDSTALLYLTDTLGQKADNLFLLNERVFMPDSSWQIKVTVKNENAVSSFLAVTMTNADTTLRSTPVELKKVSFKMNSVMTGNNIPMNFNSDRQAYSYYLPDITDLSSQKFLFNHSGDRITLDGTTLKNGEYNIIDASKPFTVSVWCYDLHKDYTIKLSYLNAIIVSDVISAYEAEGTATVRMRTIPWNILQKDSTAHISLTDSLGNPISKKVSMVSKEFMADSTWTVRVKVLDNAADNAFMSFALTIPDTTIISSAVELKKVSFGMNSVMTGNNAMMKYKSDKQTYVYYLPAITDLTSQQFLFNHSGDKITLKGDILKNNVYNTIDASQPFTVSVWRYDLHKEYTIRLSYLNAIIVSDTISAYEANGQATVRMRTLPWDILQNDSTASFTLTDSLGNAIDNKVSITNKEFSSSDSTWTIKVKVLNTSATSTLMSVALSIPDTTVISSAVELKKVSFKMSTVYVSGKKMSYDSNTMTYSYCLPTVTDFSDQSFKFNHTGHKVIVGDSVLADHEYHTLNASKPITVYVWMYDIYKAYSVKLYNTGLPVVRINTNGQNITSRKDWYQNITMRIEYPDGTVDYDGTLEIRGRGNGTWIEGNDFSVPAKKPYAIRLSEKAKILGMHKHSRWILLANYKDRTLLRNDAAYWLSRQTDLPYTINGQYVELVWNGVHKGSYYLCEQAKIDNHRIDIADPDLENPQNGGIFLEIDTYYNYYTNHAYPKKQELGFTSDYFKVPYIFKEPDENMINTSSPAYTYVKNYINNLESILMNDTKLKNHEYEQYLDVDKAIDFLLIQELTMNNDSYNTWPSNGPHSTFIYMDSCGKICFGPVWDFDYHTFTLKDERGNTSSRLEQWELLTISHKANGRDYYFNRLKGDPEFKRRLIDRWDMHKDKFKQLPTYIRTMADSIRLSESENYKVWGAINNPNGNQNGDQDLSFQEAVNAMIEAFNKRWDWIELKIGYYRNDINYH